VTGRKAVTVRAAIAEFKMSPALKDKRKADLRKKRHAKLVAVAQDTQDEAKTAHAVAEEALAGRRVAVENARNEGYAEGVAAKKAFTGKQAAAGATVTAVDFYALVYKSSPDSTSFPYPMTLEEVQKALRKEGMSHLAAVHVSAVYTVTPYELPPDEPPVKPFGGRWRYAAKRRKEAPSAATHTPEKFEKEYAAGVAAEAAEAAEACTDCGSKIVAPADGVKHGKINQCEECGIKVEAETVIGVLIADGKSDYSIEIGLPSEGYGESLKHSQKKLA
jgi:predicted RNA-binding Zn-ribbon protein involved in translation (DUF1610 family)